MTTTQRNSEVVEGPSRAGHSRSSTTWLDARQIAGHYTTVVHTGLQQQDTQQILQTRGSNGRWTTACQITRSFTEVRVITTTQQDMNKNKNKVRRHGVVSAGSLTPEIRKLLELRTPYKNRHLWHALWRLRYVSSY